MARFCKTTSTQALAGVIVLAFSLGGLGAGCGDGDEAVPQATSDSERGPEASPVPVRVPLPDPVADATPELAPEVSAEDTPGTLVAVVAARPHSDALKAALADVTATQRARTNPFAGRPGEAGQADYTLLCASCHGATGQGGGEASVALGGTATNLLQSVAGESLSEGERFAVIKHGVGGTHMQDFGAARSDNQLWKILAYISSLR
jgi:mono/diheme cytochrome c family protein